MTSAAPRPRATSLRLRAATQYLRWQRGPTRTLDQLKAEYFGRPYPKPAPIPGALRRLCEVREAQVAGHTVYTLTPRANASDWHILYTHGGAFVHTLVRSHWHIIAELVRTTGASVTVPIYPLAPEHQHGAAATFLQAVYEDVRSRTQPRRIAFCGDSAGGNLALTQAMRYRDQKLPLPARLILFSPWLDLSMSNPEAARTEPLDVMLRCSELVERARWWAGDEDLRAPLLSPIYGDLQDLPPIDIFQGSNDVLAPDARLLRTAVESVGGRAHYDETAGAFHVFMGATFAPEAKAVFKAIADRLTAPGA